MINFSWLYFDENDDSTVYSRNPADKFVIERIFNGEEAAWEKEETRDQKRKKTLLLCDPTTKHWPEEKHSHIKTILQQLLQEGFRIFVWQQDHPVSLSLHDLYLLDNKDFKQKISPLHPTIMQLAMSTHQCLPNALLFLNYFNINRLRGKENFTKIDTYDFAAYDLEAVFDLEMEKLATIFAQGDIFPTEIVHSFYSQHENKVLKGIKKHFPDLPIYTKITHVNFDGTNENISTCLFKTFTPQSLTFSSFDSFRNITWIEELDQDYWQSLEIYDPYQLTDNYSSTILERAFQLKKLKIHSMEYLLNEKWFTDHPRALANLEEIDITSSNTHFNWGEFFSSLAKRATKLRSITLNLRDMNLQEEFFKGFHALENVTLRSPLSFEALLSLLKETKNLQTLRLRGPLSCNTSLKDFSSPLFSTLKELELTNEIPDEVLFTILSNSNKLVHLKLNRLNIAKSVFNPPPLCSGLRYLERLEIQYVTGIEEYLTLFLSQAMHLKKLTVGDIKSLPPKAILSLKSKKFEKLETLIACRNIPQPLLYILLGRAPHIKSINLLDCQFGNTSPLIEKFNFTALEVLTIERGCPLLGFLYQALSGASSLKTLALSDQPMLSLNNTQYNFSNLPLTELENFEYSTPNKGVLIAENLLFHFLKQTPNLKKLSLVYCTGNRFLQPLETSSLKKLEEVEITFCHFTANTLSFILNNASDLQTLAISESHIDNSPFHFFNSPEKTFKKLHYLHLGYNTHCPAEVWLSLVEKAKNLKYLDITGILEGKYLSTKWFESHPDHFRYLKTLTVDIESVSEEFFTRVHERAKLYKLVLWYFNENLKIAHEKSAWFREAGDIVAWEYNDSIDNDLNDNEEDNTRSTWECDANTENEEGSFHIDRIFYAKNTPHPDPSRYRQSAFNALEVKKEVLEENKSPFSLYNVGDIDLVDCIVSWEKSSADLLLKWDSLPQETPRYYGAYKGKLPNEWRALPSLSPHEKIVSVYSNEFDEKDVELKYSLRDNLYYFRKKEDNDKEYFFPIKLEFLIDVPPMKNHHALNHPGIRQLVDSLNYGDEERAQPLEIIHDDPTGEDYLRAIKTQKQGSCRHRTIVFMAEIANMIADTILRARAILNTTHAYGEFFWEGEWYQCDFGGYAAEMNIAENLAPLPPSSFLTGPSQEATPFQPAPKKPLNPKFMTWLSSEKMRSALHIKEFIGGILSEYQGRNALLEVHSEEESEAYRLLIQQYCQEQKREVYYIDQANDFICSAKWVKRLDNNQAKRMPGPGGACHEFLTKPHASPPVIVVNYTSFRAEDIVRFNSSIELDARFRMADVTKIPENTTIIGLSDISQSPYQGDDFYDRFHNPEKRSPLDSQAVIKDAKDLMSPLSSSKEATASINLHHSSEWRSMLLGHWVLAGTYCSYKEGKLEKWLKKGHTHIDLQNAPSHLREFRVFMQQTMLHKKMRIVEKDVKLPEHFKTSTSIGQDWDAFNSILHWQTEHVSDYYLLNPTTFGKFLGRYQYNEADRSLTRIAGWIKENNGKTINIVLTRNLNHSQWTRLLAKCLKHNVKLNIVPSQDVSLPPELVTPEKAIYSPKNIHPKTQLIETDDPDYAIEKIYASDPHAKVIEISEVEAERLMNTFDLEDVDDVRLYFKRHYGVLWTALRDNEHVVLKGRFSLELIDRLSMLCLPHTVISAPEEPLPFNGRLTMVSHNMQGFKKFLGDRIQKQTFSLEEKLKWFKTDKLNNIILEKLKKKKPLSNSFSFLHTLIFFFRKTYNNRHIPWGQNPWHGLKTLTSSMLEVDFNMDNAAYQDFEKKRLEQIEATLEQAPYVFIAGLTGVGKSTFIEKVIGTNKNYKLYRTFEQLKAWAEDTSTDQCKVLFIDEANLDQTDFSIFEGLYHRPPSILINGIYYRLDQKHKVIFAGNPLSYGAGRRIASLFKRHGNVVIFSPLSAAYIYHEILSPLLDHSLTEAEKRSITEDFMRIYQRICTYSEDSVLLTPRELEMMAMLTLVKMKEGKGTLSSNALYSAYRVAKNVVPEKKLADFDEWFNQQFGYLPISKPDNYHIALETDKVGDFVLTPSRQEAFNILSDMLALRQYQQHHGENTLQMRAGLGGILIEGEPGDGKSHFVTAVLNFSGFTLVEPHEIAHAHGDIYCYIPASMPSEEKKKNLLDAFHAGAVVVMNEMNSCSFHEKLLNNLLMGLDEMGNPAKRPGFKIIGTTNPAIRFAGRRMTSAAIKRRTLSCDYLPYSAEEIRFILMNKYHLTEEKLDELIDDFMRARRYADKHHLPSKPTFRLLLTCCKEHHQDMQTLYQEKDDNWWDDLPEAPPYFPIFGHTKRGREPEEEITCTSPNIKRMRFD